MSNKESITELKNRVLRDKEEALEDLAEANNPIDKANVEGYISALNKVLWWIRDY